MIIAEPGANALTAPVADILAIVGALVLQVPVVTVLVSDCVCPSQIALKPVIVPASGCGLTRIICVSLSVPQILVTE